MTDSTVRVRATGLIDPGLITWLKRKPREGIVRADGTLDLDNHETTDLSIPTDADIPPGTRLKIRIRRGNIVGTPDTPSETQQGSDEDSDEQASGTDSRTHDAREAARTFWDRYDIPFEHDVAIKGRRSGLLRGSDGTGRTRRTARHLFVQEAFSEGRLSREADRYLCTDEAKFRFTEGVRHTDADDNEYVPSVTCQTCLKRMRRWKRSSEE